MFELHYWAVDLHKQTTAGQWTQRPSAQIEGDPHHINGFSCRLRTRRRDGHGEAINNLTEKNYKLREAKYSYAGSAKDRINNDLAFHSIALGWA